MPTLLNEQIAALRKERGFTQERLGQLLGVSAQAVSKWEKGGAPDVELLPALADALGVTIDALFDREGGERIDIIDTVRRWMVTLPRAQRLDWLCQLIWAAAPMTETDDPQYQGIFNGPREKSCWDEYTRNGKAHRWLRRVRMIGEAGMVLGFHSDELSWASVFPEPETGWDPFLADNERYRSLFAVLARPHCLELLEYLNSKPCYTGRRYTPDAIAGALGIEAAEADALLEALSKLDLLSRTELESKDGVINCYLLDDVEALVPFLYSARWLMAGDGGAMNTFTRVRPILRGEKWKEKEEN